MTYYKAQVRQEPGYTPAGFFVLRAPALSANVFTSLTATSGSEASEDDPHHALALCRDQVRQLAGSPEIERALLVASSSIIQGIKSLQQEEPSQRRAARAYSRLLRYLIRMSTRPTPFGLFSGVAAGMLAEQTTLQLREPALQRMRTRPDLAWLLAVIEQIEQEKPIWTHLQVQVNHTAYLAHDRVIVPVADIYGKGDHRSITLRAVAPVRYLLEHARQPVAYRELRSRLIQAFPSVAEQKIDSLLEQLWEQHVLLSDLRPPLTCANPTGYVVERLRQVPEAAEILALLEEVLAAATHVDLADSSHSASSIHRLLTLQKRLVPHGGYQPFQVDAALQLEGSLLNKTVGEAAALAAETLLSCGRAPQGIRHLYDYHRAFIDHYGVGAEVPLLELLHTDRGLGSPQGYRHPEPETQHVTSPGADRQHLDQFLLTLATDAINQQRTEVILTDAMTERLVQLSPRADTVPPLSLAILLQLQAASREAIDRGEWRIILGPNALSTGAGIAGRFFDVLGDEGLQRLREFARKEEALLPDVIFAELSYLPPAGRAGNVAIRPMLRQYEIVVNTAATLPPERVIALHDLVVGATPQRLYIRSLRQGKEVIVCQNHVLNPESGPNICRFLLEVSRMRYTLPAQFDWGAASSLPFLPRVVQGNAVLSPARWKLYRAAIAPTGSGPEGGNWLRAIEIWRKSWHVPRFVYLVERDNRLLLDLEHPAFLTELVTELKKREEQEPLVLQEMAPDLSQLWLRDTKGTPFFSELVVPLLRTQKAAELDAAVIQPAAACALADSDRALTVIERREAPGSQWTYLKLYLSAHRQDELISTHLCRFVHQLSRQQVCDRWFYLRYYDPDPHLRVRFHAVDLETSQEVLLQAVAWGQQLMRQGFIGQFCVDTYRREIERYGGRKAIDHLEQAFSIDSNVVSLLVHALYQRRLTLDPSLIAVMSLDALVSAWGLTLEQRVQYSQRLTRKYRFADEFRKRRQLLCQLLDPRDRWGDQSIQSQREYAGILLAYYAPALQSIAQTVEALAEQGLLKQEKGAILQSLAHMHINRLLGVNEEQEALVYAFWHHALRSITLRSFPGTSQKMKEYVLSGHILL